MAILACLVVALGTTVAVYHQILYLHPSPKDYLRLTIFRTTFDVPVGYGTKFQAYALATNLGFLYALSINLVAVPSRVVALSVGAQAIQLAVLDVCVAIYRVYRAGTERFSIEVI